MINADGTVTVPAGANVEIRPADGLIVRAVTDVVTILAKLSSPLVRSVSIKPIGAISGTATIAARHIGDGWWLWTGPLAIAGQTSIKNVFLVIDNRLQGQSVYTPAAVTVLKVLLVDGTETCGGKFGNIANFRGFPHIPGQDAVLRYATRAGGHEGDVL